MPLDAECAHRRSRSELAKYEVDVPPELPVRFGHDEIARLRPVAKATARRCPSVLFVDDLDNVAKVSKY